MLIKIGDFEFTSVWDGVFYKKRPGIPLLPIGRSGRLSNLWNMKHPTEENVPSNVRMPTPWRKCRMPCKTGDTTEMYPARR